MRPLSAARLRRMASGLHLELEEEELTRLLPMVRDLLNVSHKLRNEQSVGIDRPLPRDHVPHHAV